MLSWSRCDIPSHLDHEGIYWSVCDSRGNHLHVPCRSVCDRDQNWIKRSKPFWGADQGIKVTSKLLKINNQERTTAMWPLTLENQAIKSLRREQSSDQPHFLPIKKLDRGHKHFYRWHVSDYPLWLVSWLSKCVLDCPFLKLLIALDLQWFKVAMPP